MSTYTLAADGTYTDSRTGGRFKYHAGAVLQTEDAVALGMPGATADAAPNPFPTVEAAWLAANAVGEDAGGGGATLVTEARTATVTGATTGTISDPASGTVFVTVTSDDANKIIVLPTPTPGTTVALFVAATGYELRTSAPASIAINGGSGANAESAIPSGTLTVCVCVSATAWRCTDQAADGSVVTTEAAAA
jgi:hypothetical protein